MQVHFIAANQVRKGDTIFPGQKHEDRVARVDQRVVKTGALRSVTVRLYNQDNVLIAKFNALSKVTVAR